MKNFKFFYLFAFVSMALLTVGCDDDEGTQPENQITITIEEPTPNEVITDCADVHVHIEISATDENHEVEVVLHPEGDVDDKILDIDLHEHDADIDIEQEVDLCSYPAGTCFHLEVEACIDHDCAEKQTADVEFCLQ